eukprot:6378903-Amphidinium_carterae.1
MERECRQQVRIEQPQQHDLEHRIQACENKILNMGAAVERCARACQITTNHVQAFVMKLQIVHDAAAMALQQSVRMRALMGPFNF